MKTYYKRISKRSLALILGILMLFSTLMVGTISNVNAYADGDVVIKSYFDNWTDHYVQKTGNSYTYVATSSNVGKTYNFDIDGYASSDHRSKTSPNVMVAESMSYGCL